MNARLWLRLLCAVVVVLAIGSGSSAAGSSMSGAGDAPSLQAVGPATKWGSEVPGLRTRTSRTYLVDDQGQRAFQAVFFTHPVNYLDASGVWQPIDDTLVADGSGGFTTKANSVSVHLPSSLSGGVSVSSPAGTLGERLTGASGAVSVAGATANYAHALSGVDASYSALPDGVKESLSLASSSSASVFTYALSVPAGDSAAASADGGVLVSDPGGARVFELDAPSVADAAGIRAPLQSLLSPSASGYTLTLTVDAAWLRAPARKFPVVVDPTITASPTQDCTLSQAAPTTSTCSQPTLEVGSDGTNASRSVLSFDLSSLNNRVEVINADLQLYVQSETSSTPISVSAYPVTGHAFTGSANWNSYDGTNAWAAPGGDYATLPETDSSVGGATGVWADLYPIELVQGWINGSIANDGVLLKETTENQTNVVSFASSEASADQPVLVVRYAAQLGLEGRFSMQEYPIDADLTASVNRANGNLILQQHLLDIHGSAAPFSLTASFNNLDFNAWSLGEHWMVGADNFLLDEPKAAVISGPFADGRGVFLKNSDGSYQTPPGWDAKLVKNADGTFTLSWDKSGEVDTYPAGSGNATKEVDRNGNTFTFSYSPGNLPLAITDVTLGRTLTFHYNGSAQLTSISDSSDSRSWTFTYTSGGLLHTYTNPNNETTTFNYDASPSLTQIIDPNGNQTNIHYDNWWRVTQITRVSDLATGSGPTTGYAYQTPGSSCPENTLGQTVMTDPNGHPWTYCYDNRMRILRSIDPDGDQQTSDYTSANGGSNCADDHPCSQTDALGNMTAFNYYTQNEVANGVQGGEDLKSTQSQPERTTGSPLPTLSYGSGHPFQPARYTDPEYAGPGTGNHSWLYTYDTPGNLASKSEGDTDPGQNPVTFAYNPDGTLKTATDAKGNVTQYCYDATQNCTGATTHLLTAIIPPSPLGKVTFSYDSLNRIQTITDGKGQTRTYTYDTLDRVRQIDYAGGPTLTYGYDADGNLTSMSDGSTGSYIYHPNNLNQLGSEDQPGPRTIGYSYDANGNLTEVDEADGDTTYTYNNENLVATIVEPGGAKTTSFSYDKNGNRIGTDLPNGLDECVKYDGAQRVTLVQTQTGDCTTLSPSPLTSFSYDYSVGGIDTDLRQSITAQYPGQPTATTTFNCYDNLARLASAGTGTRNCPATPNNGAWGDPNAPYQYVYDKNGNISSKQINGTTTNYTYNAANELLGNGNPPFDQNGSMTSDPGVISAATYNPLDQMTTVTPTGGSPDTLTYTGLGQSRRTGNGSISQINDQLGLEADTGNAPTTYFTRDPDGAMLGERQGGSSYYFLHDGLGSVTTVTDSGGNIIANYHYDPYGTTTCTSPNNQCSFYEPIRYAGGYWDGNTTGDDPLYKFGERYYDPTIGRWTQIDPVDNPLDLHGWNQYIYAGDDPINATDPSGLCWTGFCWASHAAKHVWHFVKKHENAISCGFFVAGVALGLSELYIGTREGLAVGKAIQSGVRYSGHIARLGTVGAASGLSFAANIATGGCSAVGGL